MIRLGPYLPVQREPTEQARDAILKGTLDLWVIVRNYVLDQPRQIGAIVERIETLKRPDPDMGMGEPYQHRRPRG